MKHSIGSLEIIAGPMFSGKTEELIRRVRRAYYSKKSVIVFKHALDIRYKKSRVTSHNGISIRSKIVHGARDILKKVNARTQIVAIDEAMWFGTDLIEVVSKLVSDGKRVIVSGLSVTFTKEPFEPIPTLMALADKVDKFSALCTRCGNEAVFHKKIGTENRNAFEISSIHVGEKSVYEARCRACFDKP